MWSRAQCVTSLSVHMVKGHVTTLIHVTCVILYCHVTNQQVSTCLCLPVVITNYAIGT